MGLTLDLPSISGSSKELDRGLKLAPFSSVRISNGDVVVVLFNPCVFNVLDFRIRVVGIIFLYWVLPSPTPVSLACAVPPHTHPLYMMRFIQQRVSSASTHWYLGKKIHYAKIKTFVWETVRMREREKTMKEGFCKNDLK